MPGSKTDTAVRFPEREDQKRRLRNVTQDRQAVARMQKEGGSAQSRTEDLQNWGTEELLDINMNESGDPNPDPAVSSTQTKAKKGKQAGDVDLYEAMNADFD